MFNVSRRGWFRGLCGAVVSLVASRRVAGGTASSAGASGYLGGVPEPSLSAAKLSGCGPGMVRTTTYDSLGRITSETYFENPRTTFLYEGDVRWTVPELCPVTTFTYHAPADRV